MNKKILIVAALLMVVCVGGAFGFAIGVQGGGGYPAGGGVALTFKLDSPWVFAVDAHFGRHHTIIGLTGDYWFLADTLVDTPIGPFGWFLGGGFGVGLALGDDVGVRLAGRLPIGLNLMIPVASLELEPYVQLVPALGVNIGYGGLFYFGIDANIGLRLHF